jgi:hypothetical protein
VVTIYLSPVIADLAAMTTKRQRERIDAAELAGLRARIVSQWRQTEEAADRVLGEWDQEARERGLDRSQSAYWDDGAKWIEERIVRT